MSNLYPTKQLNENLKKFCKLLNRFQLEKDSKKKSKVYRKLKRFLINHPEMSVITKHDYSGGIRTDDIDNYKVYPNGVFTKAMFQLFDTNYTQIEIKENIQKSFNNIELKNIIYGLCPPGINIEYLTTPIPIPNHTRPTEPFVVQGSHGSRS